MDLLGMVARGALDYLLVDLPPGTGDPSITVAGTLPRASVITVTTPQAVALADVRKAIFMFRRLGTRILGIVENTAYFCCAHSQERIPIFGSGGGEALGRELGISLLASLPIDMALRESGDLGEPLAAAQPDAPASRALAKLADCVAEDRRMPNAHAALRAHQANRPARHSQAELHLGADGDQGKLQG
jgi:ATP-binding protein involved in chromosome partitioning